MPGLIKKVFKKVAKAANPGGPSLKDVAKAAKRYNPVTGPIKAIKKVTKTLQAPPKKGRR